MVTNGKKNIELKTKKNSNINRLVYQNNINTFSQAKLELQKKKHNIKILITVLIVFLIMITLLLIGRPRLEMIGSSNLNIVMDREYKDPGVKAKIFGQDVSSKVKIENNVNVKKAGTYKVKYGINYMNTVIKKIRTVVVNDHIKPQLTLTGDAIIYMEVNTKYEELGYQAIDNNDGDITKKVKVENKVDANKTGTYKIEYIISDSSGNKEKVTRTVIVTKKSDPNLKTIYLTFDDGPSTITPQVLDVLKRNDVKATFFLIGRSPSYDDTIKRIHNEGHTVAIHSNTHNYGYIYSSEKDYFEDLYALQNRLKNITGVSPNVIRFPGGSSNTVSKFNNGIMSRLTVQVIQKGFSYFDWNIDSGDTGRIGSDAIVNNVTSSLGDYNTYVVLMHDYAANQQTADALDRIIKYGKNNGYRFDKLTTDTPVVHHGVNN